MQAEGGVVADSGWKSRMKHRPGCAPLGNTSSQKHPGIALLGSLPKILEISQLPGPIDLEIS